MRKFKVILPSGTKVVKAKSFADVFKKYPEALSVESV